MLLTRQISFGIGAGAIASLLLLASLQTPLVFQFLLLLIAPLPIFGAGLGAGWPSAVVAGIVGALVIGIGFHAGAGFGFLVLQAVPATVLSYLVSLHRTDPSDTSAGQTEWYPVGRLVVWSAFFAGLLGAVSLLSLGTDLEELRTKLRGVVEKIVENSLSNTAQNKALADLDLDVLTNVTLHLLPAAVAISLMGGLLFSLWMSGRIAQTWGWLSRPWPDLAAVTYPSWTPLCLTMALAASFIPGLYGLAAGAFAGAFVFAYMLLGLAIIHFVTRGQPLRPLLLWMAYAAVIFAGIGFAIILAIIGLAEPVSPLRRDFQNKGPGGT